MCAIATYPREDLNDLLNDTEYRKLLDSVPAMACMLRAFYNRDYHTVVTILPSAVVCAQFFLSFNLSINSFFPLYFSFVSIFTPLFI